MTQDSTRASAGEAPAEISFLASGEPQFLVLHVNDSTDDQVLFQAACRRGQVPFVWHVTDSAAKGISYLKTLVEHGKTLPVCWPDLVLLDVVMPLASGFEVLKYIRATSGLRSLPVVIFSGDTRGETENESVRLGANLFLLKPVEFKEIVKLARNLYEMLRKMREGGFFPSKGG